MKIEGIVTGGNKLGRKLGFPTANIAADDHPEIPDGVYAARVQIATASYDAMAYLGRKPSVGGSARRMLEAHIFDFTGDLYDRFITIELGRFIRPEQRFDSFEELRRQLALDAHMIRNSHINN